jgi:transposase
MYPEVFKHRAIFRYMNVQRSLRKVSQIFQIGKSTLARWVRPLIRPRERTSILERARAHIAEIIEEHPFCTIADVASKLRDRGLTVSCSSAWRAVRRAGFSPKRPKLRTSRREPSLEECEAFLQGFRQTGERISVDESCIYLNDPPRRGYSRRGQRIIHRTATAPRRRKISLLLAISETRGVIAYTTTKDSVNTAYFNDFLRNIDAPTGSIVILDNVSFHHSRAVKETAVAKGIALLYPPPYSPDFNPVENSFSVLKAALRKDGRENLLAALQTVTIPKCSAFFRHAEMLVELEVAKLRPTTPNAS